MTLPPALQAYAHQILELALLAVGFFVLALLVKGMRAMSDARAAAAETKTNLVLYVMDTLTVAPALTFASSGRARVRSVGLRFSSVTALPVVGSVRNSTAPPRLMPA